MTPIVAIVEPGEIRVAGVQIIHRAEHCVVLDIDCNSKRPQAGTIGMMVMLEADEHTRHLDRRRVGRATLVRFEGIDESKLPGFTDWYCDTALCGGGGYFVRVLFVRNPEPPPRLELRLERARFFVGWPKTPAGIASQKRLAKKRRSAP